jgi:aspartyl-tRNA(Asn)/glutamyl-tRNA(Gln) amidotransferase subunit C
VAVTHDDVRHIADLARLGVAPSRLDGLVSELNGILAHMEVLAQVSAGEVTDESGSTGMPVASTPLRSDSSGPIPMLLPLESFAPETRDGFIIVPRLASHAILKEKGDATIIGDGSELNPGSNDEGGSEL